jgi:hypothetical protein
VYVGVPAERADHGFAVQSQRRQAQAKLALGKRAVLLFDAGGGELEDDLVELLDALELLSRSHGAVGLEHHGLDPGIGIRLHAVSLAPTRCAGQIAMGAGFREKCRALWPGIALRARADDAPRMRFAPFASVFSSTLLASSVVLVRGVCAAPAPNTAPAAHDADAPPASEGSAESAAAPAKPSDASAPAPGTGAPTEETPESGATRDHQPAESATPPESQTTPAVSAPATAPVVSSSVAQNADRNAQDGRRGDSRERLNLPLTFEARAGLSARLGGSAATFDEEELFATAYGLGAWLEPSQELAFGLELEHAGLGNARDLSGLSSVDVEYSVTSAWLATRVFPTRKQRVDAFVALRLGLGWQSVSATGTREQFPTTAPARVFSCSEREGPGLSLGGGAGLNLRVSRRVSLVPRVDFVGQRLTGEALGSCALGVGSVTAAAATLGLGYAFDVEPESGSASTQARRD